MILERCTEYMSAIKYDFLDYVCNRLSFFEKCIEYRWAKKNCLLLKVLYIKLLVK